MATVTPSILSALRFDLTLPENKKAYKTGVEKRIFNIKSFSELDRTTLERDVVERRILLYTTKSGEKIYIHYPGKESKNDDKSKERPWDFRPKTLLTDTSFCKDLSFKDIWDDIVDISKRTGNPMAIPAALFFRISYMLDVELVKECVPYYDINPETEAVVGRGTIEIEWYKLKYNNDLIDYLNQTFGPIRGMSFEAYLYYNDLLCQNEDCKYYYRDVVLNPKKLDEPKWGDGVGRKNTIWTHLNVISYLQGYTSLTDMMYKFQMGVAPIAMNLIGKVTGDLIITKHSF